MSHSKTTGARHTCRGVVCVLGAGMLMVAGAALATGLVPPGNTPHRGEAGGIVDRAIRAHGGLEAWQGKRDAAFSTTWTHHGDDGVRVTSRYVIKFPIEAGGRRALIEGIENGRPVRMGVSDTRSWFLVGQDRHDDTETLEANRSFIRRAWSLLSLPFRLDHPGNSFVWDGEELLAGAIVDRVRAGRNGRALGVFLFDRETGRLAGIGSAVSGSPGRTIGEYHAFDRVEGILIPTKQVFNRLDPDHGGPRRALTLSVDRVTFNNEFPPEMFEPPAID